MDRFRSQRGVTLIEALVATLVGVIALLGLYALVDASNKLTKQQTEVADVQQSARIGVSEISRIIRQSRVGGLYFGNSVLPIANNIAGGTFYTDTSDRKHYVRRGTDVIEVRGAILGDKYVLDAGDVTCSGSCPGGVVCPGACDLTTQVTVTIHWRASFGYVNFPFNGRPSLADKTRSFYFAVLNGENQALTVNGSTYLVPIYVVGLVNASANPFPCTLNTPTWCTLTNPDTSCDPATSPCTYDLSFRMNPQDTGARELNATTTLPAALAKSIAGAPIDVVRFFVDEGTADQTGTNLDTHPSLDEAILDPSTGGPTTGKWDVQPLIEEAEDFQIAYGIDGAPCPTNTACHDGGTSPVAVDLSGVNNDEWVGNVATEVGTTLPIVTTDANHSGVDAFLDASIASGQPASPALRSVWISLVVKSTSPELVYDGPGARGIKILDSAAVSFSAATGHPYRRRPLSLAVSLRNNALTNR